MNKIDFIIDVKNKIVRQRCGHHKEDEKKKFLQIKTLDSSLLIWTDEEWFAIIAISMLEELPKEMVKDLLENSDIYSD